MRGRFLASSWKGCRWRWSRTFVLFFTLISSHFYLRFGAFISRLLSSVCWTCLLWCQILWAIWRLTILLTWASQTFITSLSFTCLPGLGRSVVHWVYYSVAHANSLTCYCLSQSLSWSETFYIQFYASPAPRCLFSEPKFNHAALSAPSTCRLFLLVSIPWPTLWSSSSVQSYFSVHLPLFPSAFEPLFCIRFFALPPITWPSKLVFPQNHATLTVSVPQLAYVKSHSSDLLLIQHSVRLLRPSWLPFLTQLSRFPLLIGVFSTQTISIGCQHGFIYVRIHAWSLPTSSIHSL